MENTTVKKPAAKKDKKPAAKREAKATDKATKVAATKKTKEDATAASKSKSKPKSEKKEQPPAAEKGEKGKRRKKDQNAPKKPVCAFFWYQRDSKNAIKDPQITTHKDRIREMSKVFKGLTPEQRAPYEDQSRKDKDRYLREKEAYNKKKAAEEKKAAPAKKGEKKPAAKKETKSKSAPKDKKAPAVKGKKEEAKKKSPSTGKAGAADKKKTAAKDTKKPVKRDAPAKSAPKKTAEKKKPAPKRQKVESVPASQPVPAAAEPVEQPPVQKPDTDMVDVSQVMEPATEEPIMPVIPKSQATQPKDASVKASQPVEVNNAQDDEEDEADNEIPATQNVPKLKLTAEKIMALKREFAMMDANKDGFITRDELVKLMPEEDPSIIDEMIKVADIQVVDGKINFSEFVSAQLDSEVADEDAEMDKEAEGNEPDELVQEQSQPVAAPAEAIVPNGSVKSPVKEAAQDSAKKEDTVAATGSPEKQDAPVTAVPDESQKSPEKTEANEKPQAVTEMTDLNTGAPAIDGDKCIVPDQPAENGS